MIKTFDTLYKRTNTGAVQIWFMEVEGEKYRSTSGQIDGKKTTTEWTIAKPKNEGRANATSAEQQAIAEVEAEYKKKIKKDYRRSLDDIDSIERFKPMLAEKWGDRKDKVHHTHVHMQPKLDGIRCIARKEGLFTRNGERIVSCPHIFTTLNERVFSQPEYENIIFDGELYNHDFRDNFNTITSIVKKQKPTSEDIDTASRLMQYHVYDLPVPAGNNFAERSSLLIHIVSQLLIDTSIKAVATVNIPFEDVDVMAANYIEAGYEGGMVRLPGAYENKRSKTLLKWKEFQDEEFEIVDIQEGDGNRSGMAARVILRLESDQTFAAGIIGNVDYCRQLLLDRHKHIGNTGTVVFQNYTPDGVPRFPKLKAIRDYE